MYEPKPPLVTDTAFPHKDVALDYFVVYYMQDALPFSSAACTRRNA